MPGAGWAESLVCVDCLREASKILVVGPRKGPVWQKAKCRPRMGGGAGLPVREALLPASSRPPSLGIHLGFTGLKSSLPTDVQKAKALMAASALASPVRSSPGSLP